MKVVRYSQERSSTVLLGCHAVLSGIAPSGEGVVIRCRPIANATWAISTKLVSQQNQCIPTLGMCKFSPEGLRYCDLDAEIILHIP